MAPALALGAAHGALRHRAIRTLATTVLQRVGAPSQYLTFTRVLEEAVARGELAPLLAPAKAFLQTLAERVSKRRQGHVARLELSDLTDLVDVPDAGRFASPDVILWIPEKGKPARFVIGEVHPYVFAWGSQGQFAPDSAALQSAFTEDLSPWGGRAQMATVLRRRRHKGLVTDAFPGTFIEVTGRAVADDARRVAVSELTVTEGPNGPRLHSPKGPLSLYVGEDDHPHLRAFAPGLVDMPPVRLGMHTPRIELGDVVIQRERWDLDEGAAELGPLSQSSGGRGLFQSVMGLRRSLGWPRFVFLGSPHEPKPLCLDLESPFAQAHLLRLVRLGRIAVVEMLPDPAGLWLSRQSGPHTSEWRMGMVRAP
jgi:hypothetical protein